MIYQIIRGRQSISTLMQAYAMVTYGATEPDTLRCHPSFLPWFYQQISEQQKSPIPTFFQDEETKKVFHFMNATLKPDTRMKHNEVKFENSTLLHDPSSDPRFHCKVVFQ